MSLWQNEIGKITFWKKSSQNANFDNIWIESLLTSQVFLDFAKNVGIIKQKKLVKRNVSYFKKFSIYLYF